MKQFLAAAALVLAMPLVHARGPVAPKGWNGSDEATLPNGQPCCSPADLNGAGLVGGAFVLLSDNKSQFALFALSYTPPLNEHWQLLEKHPISQLKNFRVSVSPAGNGHFGIIRACIAASCALYSTSSVRTPFERVEGPER